MTAERESGSVLVYMNRTVTDQSRQPLYDAAGCGSTTARSAGTG
ncbi:MCE-associated protein [Mycolicibacterium conceptionense]|uniref:MCE-associated protein n=1 Tax=Mycolicibacterium conceptionense TaxID=451644 RepID=A0A0U1DYB3_9MYCO|nr:MCE-associated protein [Mycolicibacterium conceptionense]